MTDVERWGIQDRYLGSGGDARQAPAAAVAAVLTSLRRGEEVDHPSSGDAVHVCHPGDALPERLRGATLVTEQAIVAGPIDRVPADLAIGYHRLEREAGVPVTLIVSKGACHLPEGLRAWGWALQLYAARSRASWGMGDLADARTLGEWSTTFGGQALLLLNPLHAVNPGADPEPSPYYAGSRCFRNPIYLRIEELPGAGALADDLAPLAAAGRALNEDRRIDRAAVWALKRDALERLWAVPHHPGPASAGAEVAADAVLGAFGAFNAAVEIHGDDWRTWPFGLRHPDGSGWGGFSRENADRIAFQAWLQGLVATQLATVQATVPVLHDLAIGTDPRGFDAWYWQDLFVLDGTRVGAPPDQFNTQGQDWGLPPIDPWRLREAAFEPFVRMVRAALEDGSGLRLDHVMGLFRLFWIPPDGEAADGVYVRQPARELLDVLAIESERAGGIVVGEDLGTVEAGVRTELDARNVLAYRVLALEETHPSHFPELALASASTHDLPTIAGLWSGSDLADQQRLDMSPNVEGTMAARARLAGWLELDEDRPITEAVLGAYRLLSGVPSRIAVGQLDDAALVPERPNMPGTVDDGTDRTWPNWSLALPLPLEAVLADPLTTQVADALAGRDPSHSDA